MSDAIKNEDVYKGKWEQVKGELHKAWGNLTGDDLEKAKGDMKHLSGVIQEKYGTTKEEASSKISEIVDRLTKSASDVVETVKEKAASFSDAAKQKTAEHAEKLDKKVTEAADKSQH